MSIKEIPLPPFIANPKDSYSVNHQRACLAWHLLRQMPDRELKDYLTTQKAAVAESLAAFFVLCKAWVLLCEKTTDEIREHLKTVPADEVEALKIALNAQRKCLKTSNYFSYEKEKENAQ